MFAFHKSYRLISKVVLLWCNNNVFPINWISYSDVRVVSFDADPRIFRGSSAEAYSVLVSFLISLTFFLSKVILTVAF